MHVLFASAEVAPYSKAGGLADVAGALPPAIARSNIRCTVISPEYLSVNQQLAGQVLPGPTGTITMGSDKIPYSTVILNHPTNQGLVHWFIQNPDFYHRTDIYTDADGEGFPDNNRRFIFFQLVILDLIQRKMITPDLVHSNDHHTALLPMLLKAARSKALTLFTVHSFLYQGEFNSQELELLPTNARALLKSEGLSLNALYAGIRFADHINTVSPTYATEIAAGKWVSPELHELLSTWKDKFSGILNGMDDHYWNPALDPHLTHHFSLKAPGNKSLNKVELQKTTKLEVDPELPLFGSVSRLVPNKGFPLLLEILPGYINAGCQFVFLGSGMADIRDSLRELNKRFPRSFHFAEGYNEPLAHLIEAGSDFFLMPSEIEPCGLNQLYSLKYGTLPIVHRTGGLADTVENWDGKTGTGFVFDEYSIAGLNSAMAIALDVFDNSAHHATMLKTAMAQDFSWLQAAKGYVQRYNQLKKDIS